MKTRLAAVAIVALVAGSSLALAQTTGSGGSSGGASGKIGGTPGTAGGTLPTGDTMGGSNPTTSGGSMGSGGSSGGTSGTSAGGAGGGSGSAASGQTATGTISKVDRSGNTITMQDGTQYKVRGFDLSGVKEGDRVSLQYSMEGGDRTALAVMPAGASGATGGAATGSGGSQPKQ